MFTKEEKLVISRYKRSAAYRCDMERQFEYARQKGVEEGRSRLLQDIKVVLDIPEREN